MNVVPLQMVDTETGEITDATFADFWTLFPRRVAKKDAQRAWIRLTAQQRMEAIVALCEWRRVWVNKDTEFLPHPATWLNGERWEDELPTEYTQTSASHRPFTEGVETKRGEMPQKVRDLLAKLRGKK